MKKLAIAAAVIVSTLFVSGTLPYTATVLAKDSKQLVCEGIGITGNNNDCTEDTSSPNVTSIIKTVVSLLSYFVGVLAIIMIIVGASKYITSGGDATKVTSAKNTLIYALVGLAVAALAQVMVRYVLFQVTNVPADAEQSIVAPRDDAVKGPR